MAFTPAQDRTWKALEKRWGDLTFYGLDPEEKEVVALFWLEGEVMNGGLHQYFGNSSGDLWPYALAGLERLGAKVTLRHMRSAVSKLGGDNYPTDRDERFDLLEALGWEEDPFDEETNAIQELPEPFFGQALDLLAKNYQGGHV